MESFPNRPVRSLIPYSREVWTDVFCAHHRPEHGREWKGSSCESKSAPRLDRRRGVAARRVGRLHMVL